MKNVTIFMLFREMIDFVKCHHTLTVIHPPPPQMIPHSISLNVITHTDKVH